MIKIIKDSRDHAGRKRRSKCKFCNKILYYRDDTRYIPELEVSTMYDFGKNKSFQQFRKFIVHLTCWKNGLALIESEVRDGIFLGLNRKE